MSPYFYRAVSSASPSKRNQAAVQEQTGWLRSEWLSVLEETTSPENQTDWWNSRQAPWTARRPHYRYDSNVKVWEVVILFLFCFLNYLVSVLYSVFIKIVNQRFTEFLTSAVLSAVNNFIFAGSLFRDLCSLTRSRRLIFAVNDIFLCKFGINKCCARILYSRGIKLANISENEVLANNSECTVLHVRYYTCTAVAYRDSGRICMSGHFIITGTESETKEFMQVCVQTIKKYPLDDQVSPVFIFERLCSIIFPVSTVLNFIFPISKQCRCHSDAAFCSMWSSSTLFA